MEARPRQDDVPVVEDVVDVNEIDVNVPDEGAIGMAPLVEVVGSNNGSGKASADGINGVSEVNHLTQNVVTPSSNQMVVDKEQFNGLIDVMRQHTQGVEKLLQTLISNKTSVVENLGATSKTPRRAVESETCLPEPEAQSTPVVSNNDGRIGNTDVSTQIQNSSLQLAETLQNIAGTFLEQSKLNLTNVAVDKPSFSGFPEENPVQFLKSFEKYCTTCRISDVDKLSKVLSCCHASVEAWLNFRGSFRDFEDFKYQFLGKYWSEPIQGEIQSRIFARYFNDRGRLNFSQFFIRQVNELRTLSIPLTESLIVSSLMRQFPANIQSLWSVYSNKTLQGALSFLETQDVLFKPSKSQAIASVQTISPHGSILDRNSEVRNFNRVTVVKRRNRRARKRLLDHRN